MPTVFVMRLMQKVYAACEHFAASTSSTTLTDDFNRSLDSTPYTDDFARADSTTVVGPGWSNFGIGGGTPTWGLLDGKVYRSTSGGAGFVLYDVGPDYDFTATYAGATSSDSDSGLAFSVDTAGQSARIWENNGIAGYNNGGGTGMVATGFPTVQPGDVVRVRCLNKAITLYRNGTQIGSITNTWAPEHLATKVGFFTSGAGGSGSVPRWDNVSITALQSHTDNATSASDGGHWIVDSGAWETFKNGLRLKTSSGTAEPDRNLILRNVGRNVSTITARNYNYDSGSSPTTRSAWFVAYNPATGAGYAMVGDGTGCELRRYTARGTYTVVATNVSPSWNGGGNTWGRVIWDGSTVTMQHESGGTWYTYGSYTDPSPLTTGTYVGLGDATVGSSLWDDFSATGYWTGLPSGWVEQAGSWEVTAAGKARVVALEPLATVFGATGKAFARYPVGIGGIDLSVELTHDGPTANGSATAASYVGSSGAHNLGQSFTTGPSALPVRYLRVWTNSNSDQTVTVGIAPGTYADAHAAHLASVISKTFILTVPGGTNNPVDIDLGSSVVLAANTTYTLYFANETGTGTGAYAVGYSGPGTKTVTGGIASVGHLQYAANASPSTSYSTLTNYIMPFQFTGPPVNSSIVFAYDPATDTGFSLDYDGGTTVALVQHNGASSAVLGTATVTAFTTATFGIVYDDVAGTITVSKGGTEIISADLDTVSALIATDAFTRADSTTSIGGSGWIVSRPADRMAPYTGGGNTRTSSVMGINGNRAYVVNDFIDSDMTGHPTFALRAGSYDFDMTATWSVRHDGGILVFRVDPTDDPTYGRYGRYWWINGLGQMGWNDYPGAGFGFNMWYSGAALSDGDVVRIRGVGTTLTYWRNGVLIGNHPDGDYRSNPACTYHGFGMSLTAATARLDDFSLSSVAVAKMTGTWAGLLTDTALADLWDEFCWTIPAVATTDVADVRMTNFAADVVLKNAAELRLTNFAADVILKDVAEARMTNYAVDVIYH